MSINSVSNPFQSYNQNGLSRMQSDFQQLGQALQSGNMGAAQQDYLTIQQLFGQNQGSPAGGLNSNGSTDSSNGTVNAAGNAATGNTGNNTVQSDFQQLGQALQSGNMGAAQQDYSNIQQLSQVIKAYNGHHRHHGVETSPVDSASVSNPDSISVLNSSSASSSSSPSSSSSGSSSSSSSSPDNNIVGQSMQSVISQYLSNSIAGGLLGGSGLLSNVLGSINISI